MWISYSGDLKLFFRDNGSGDNLEDYQQMNEKLTVETCPTAAESPFSKGTVERHSLIVTETMEKT